jgi:hypothetical protein
MAGATELTTDQQALLDQLPRGGGTISNAALQEKLGWGSDRYFSVRDVLVDAGYIVRGRGRGGTVRVSTSRPDAAPVIEPAELAQDVEAAIKGELALYEPMRQVIATDWARDHRTDPLAVEITAQQGRRATGGTWSRPDIVSVEVRTFAYVPGKHREVVTFEVKPAAAINVQAVYEALAHRRAGTHAYVLLHVPPREAGRLGDAIDDVADVARQHGIGVVTVGDPAAYQTWDEREEARRVEPDPERLDAFIATQLSEQAKNRISRRLR